MLRVHCEVSRDTVERPVSRSEAGFAPCLHRVSVIKASGKHPVPFRTRKLSLSAPMVLHGGPCGRLGRRRTTHTPQGRPPFVVDPEVFVRPDAFRTCWRLSIAVRCRSRAPSTTPDRQTSCRDLPRLTTRRPVADRSADRVEHGRAAVLSVTCHRAEPDACNSARPGSRHDAAEHRDGERHGRLVAAVDERRPRRPAVRQVCERTDLPTSSGSAATVSGRRREPRSAGAGPRCSGP